VWGVAENNGGLGTSFARERREMLTAHRIFIIAKSQAKARG
jgi:hypothetical protein